MEKGRVLKRSGEHKIKVYYDGLCHLCSREIDHYRKLRGAEQIVFVDITSKNFSPSDEGLDGGAIHKSIHVRDRDGQLHLGVDAFICIWGELPALGFLVPIARAWPIHRTLRILYSVFAKVRLLLPRKSCEDSPYCETHRKM